MVTLIPTISILLKTYSQTHFPSHAYLAISILFFTVKTSFLSTTDENGAKLFWS